MVLTTDYDSFTTATLQAHHLCHVGKVNVIKLNLQDPGVNILISAAYPSDPFGKVLIASGPFAAFGLDWS